MQWIAERRLAEQVAKTRADSGFAIVMDVKTGQLIALANSPTYDSSRPQAAKSEDRGNRAVSAPYEPGSVQKVLTSAALIDSGTVTPSTRVVIPSRLASAGRSIKDHFSHGVLHYTMRGVIADSSNIGTALLTRQLDKQKLRDYLVSFGLGAKTNIQLPGESGGIIPKQDMTDGQRDQIAFGQAIAVTGIQEAAAIAGIVNGGIYNPPTVIKRATDGEGRRWRCREHRSGGSSREEFGSGARPDAGGHRQHQRSVEPEARQVHHRRQDLVPHSEQTPDAAVIGATSPHSWDSRRSTIRRSSPTS